MAEQVAGLDERRAGFTCALSALGAVRSAICGKPSSDSLTAVASDPTEELGYLVVRRYGIRSRGHIVAGIIELLQRRGLPKIGKVKIVRHKDKRYAGLVDALVARGHFEAGYQAYQSRHIFNCDYIVSCIGLPHFQARFFGVYRVADHRPAEEVPLPPHLSYLNALDPAGWGGPGVVWYDLQKVEGFDDLENRVVIDWGPGARNWAQWATVERDKRIIEGPSNSDDPPNG